MWDVPLHHEMAGVIGIEGRAKFNGYKGTPDEGGLFRGLTFWSPNVNIFRDPRWGRGQETYGEDPFLTSRLGVAFVTGLQGTDPDRLLAAACAKHFAVHSGPESLRHIFDATPVTADIYDTYLPAFEALVREARVEVVMTAYNAINGVPCSVDPMLYGLLRQWGFDGHVTSDCGSVEDLSRTYKLAVDDTHAQALTLAAGMNVRCGWEPVGIVDAVAQGLITEDLVDERVKPLLRTMLRLGFFDPADSYPFNAIGIDQNDTPEHSALALRTARECMTLLKNDGVLPLDVRNLRRVLIVGPNADSVPALVGNYNGQPSHPVTILAGLRAALEKAGVQVDYAYGCDYADRPEGWRPIPQPWFRGEYYANGDLSGAPQQLRTERPICFECNGQSTSGGVPKGMADTGLSARWNGELQTTIAGDYQIRLRGRGGFRLWIGGESVIDSWTAPAGQEGEVRTVEIVRELPENTSIPVRLEYTQGAGTFSLALEWIAPAPDTMMDKAVALARQVDAVIYVGGLTAQLEGEEMAVDYVGFSGGDRTTIELPALQQRMVAKLAATGKPLVVVNLSGSAVALTAEDACANAVLQAWYPGGVGGTAVAEVITGEYNPAGRLPVTFYRATADLPDFCEYDMEGRTYKYFRGEALYPFGHGLSYTSFTYGNMTVTPCGDGSLQVELDLTNSGARDGDEVVQLYAVAPESSGPRELQALCGFARVHLKAGQTQKVSIGVPASALRRFCEEKGAYWVPQGTWTIRAGASSADIRQSGAVKL
jgi:beta-glucosidase